MTREADKRRNGIWTFREKRKMTMMGKGMLLAMEQTAKKTFKWMEDGDGRITAIVVEQQSRFKSAYGDRLM
jgi:hypothetical protein